MSHETTPSPEAGFTLVEALIAMVVLTFGLIAITNLFVVAASSNSIANHGTAAAAEAAEVMERLKAIRFDNLQAGGDLDTDQGPLTDCDATAATCVTGTNYNSRRAVLGVGQIKVRWTTTDIAAAGPPTKFIRVRAESLAPLAGPRSRAEFTTFRSCTLPSPPC
jgi:Tfp pilus assembly protein PilV